MRNLILILLSAMLGGCTQTLAILDGATHAKGTVHLEGYFTDSQGDVDLCKVPESYTAEDAKNYCNGE